MNPLNLINKAYGRLTVISRAENDKFGATRWNCTCSCGNPRIVVVHVANIGRIRSCGCLHKEMASRRGKDHPNYKHGQSAGMRGNVGASRTYKTWESMMRRCSNPKDKDYENYGGRGITICIDWYSFENFLADMGPRPEGMTLDRKEVNGNYEPANCRWATPLEQAQNRRPYKALSKFSDDDIKKEFYRRGLDQGPEKI